MQRLNLKVKNLPVLRARSHRVQLALLTKLSAHRAHDLMAALRVPFCLDPALHARSYILRIHLSLFLVILY